MKLLSGLELAEYIKERQAKQVRALRQAHHIVPKLAIVQTDDNPVINSYVSLKKRYAADILAEVEQFLIPQEKAAETIEQLNSNGAVHGIIVQLPLADVSETDLLINMVDPRKDVDALGASAEFDPATATAINWLLAGYIVMLEHKKIVLVGQGRLVGAPLLKMWRDSGLSVEVVDLHTPEAEFLQKIRSAEVIVTGTGVPGLIKSDMIAPGTVVVDAGVATEGGKLVGDLADDVRERDDVTITPAKGGVGPLTVCALFDNVIRAARRAAEMSQS